jgi:hypothetical protein
MDARSFADSCLGKAASDDDDGSCSMASSMDCSFQCQRNAEVDAGTNDVEQLMSLLGVSCY